MASKSEVKTIISFLLLTIFIKSATNNWKKLPTKSGTELIKAINAGGALSAKAKGIIKVELNLFLIAVVAESVP